ncbi:act minimal PKS chain-length factor (CLF/KS beta) [Prauserella shujinwangii]|uniref:Act minimal PKS chain-length factor (CLF/KS beta) n=1 Tax=Prauserella shujinwangii TaxID=1453103 RepID=A0A2T0M400_9PSEU|nr:ketosynthase chain-length factor [Prauserella shujinwangii]PRX51429.1 act minimal PKS chain-length factor (CLF/KS beta) [Prauserella shujinwangii]
MTAARAIVTGIGVVAPTGIGTEAYWSAVLRGERAIRPVTRFDASGYWARLAGEVPGFAAEEHLERRLLPQTDHMTRMALAASDWALREAGIDRDAISDDEIAVVTAATGGGYEFGQRELEKLWQQGPEFVSAYQSFAWFYAVNTGQISIRHGTRGPGAVIANEQAGGLDAIGTARRHLARGARVAVTGAVDSSMCPWAWVAHQASGGLSGSTDPDRAYLPFDVEARGYVPGEGGAILVLESAAPAAERTDATRHVEVAGYATTFDPRDPDRPPGLRRATESALADAGAEPDDIDVVFADAAGVPELDRVEADTIRGVFGPRGVPVTAPKTMTGRLFAGGGALDVATAVLTIRSGVIPPTVNVRAQAPGYDLDLVCDSPRRAPVRAALVLGRGRGGFNAAVVVRAAR